MLLDPPGWPGLPEALPHWPYVQAVDHALSDHGIPPGIVRANRTGREHGETMHMVLVWDVSRTGALGGVRLNWEEETGWAYGKMGVSGQEADWAPDRLGIKSRDALVQEPFAALRRVFASPGDVADAAEHISPPAPAPAPAPGAGNRAENAPGGPNSKGAPRASPTVEPTTAPAAR